MTVELIMHGFELENVACMVCCPFLFCSDRQCVRLSKKAYRISSLRMAVELMHGFEFENVAVKVCPFLFCSDRQCVRLSKKAYLLRCPRTPISSLGMFAGLKAINESEKSESVGMAVELMHGFELSVRDLSFLVLF